MNYNRYGLPILLSIYGIGYTAAAYELHTDKKNSNHELKYILGIFAAAYFGKSIHHIKPFNFQIKNFFKLKK